MKSLLKRATVICLVLTTLKYTNIYCQTDTAKFDEMSLKDLLNVKIVSVSKTSEFLFDAPLSASVITRENIRKKGCNSIMEALRLVPGMIVREQSNGNYDIHLRGMDNVPPNSPFDLTSNTTTLVMIDNRPIYSYLKGGTFWETLPIDLNDVERIEIIRGPAAALYGPNAVNGVINIITRQPTKNGLYIVANSRAGSLNTFINNASVGYKSGKWNVVASANSQQRNRSQNSYFEFNRNTSIDNPAYLLTFNGDTVTNIKQRYPNPELAINKYAGNIFLNYDASKKLSFNLSTGIQHSYAQKVSTENEITPLSEAESISKYVDFRAKAGELTAQISYNKGTQITDYDPGNKYDFNTLNASFEYDYSRGNFSIKPGVGYTRTVYDDTKYSDIINKTGIFNAAGVITSFTPSLRGEYKMMGNKLRLTAGASASKFNYPDKTYIAYEAAATYKANKKNLFRAVYSKASRSSTIFDTYVDQTIAFFPTGYKTFTRLTLQGNKDLKLLTANMAELGYRGKVSPALDVDVEVFSTYAKNFNTLINRTPYSQLLNTDTVQILPLISTNLPLKLLQQGITFSIIYYSDRLEINPFVTIQKTTAKDYAASLNAPGVTGPGNSNNIYSGLGTKMQLKSTPAVFGGAQINYTFTPKININISAYYYSSQVYQHISNIIINDGIRGIDHIPAKLIVNTAVSYEPFKNFFVSCNGKNLLDMKSREFFHTDEIPAMLITGLSYQF